MNAGSPVHAPWRPEPSIAPLRHGLGGRPTDARPAGGGHGDISLLAGVRGSPGRSRRAHRGGTLACPLHRAFTGPELLFRPWMVPWHSVEVAVGPLGAHRCDPPRLHPALRPPASMFLVLRSSGRAQSLLARMDDSVSRSSTDAMGTRPCHLRVDRGRSGFSRRSGVDPFRCSRHRAPLEPRPRRGPRPARGRRRGRWRRQRVAEPRGRGQLHDVAASPGVPGQGDAPVLGTAECRHRRRAWRARARRSRRRGCRPAASPRPGTSTSGRT